MTGVVATFEHLIAVNVPNSRVGDNAYQTRVAVGKKSDADS
jgi:hypothetical protein